MEVTVHVKLTDHKIETSVVEDQPLGLSTIRSVLFAKDRPHAAFFRVHKRRNVRALFTPRMHQHYTALT